MMMMSGMGNFFLLWSLLSILLVLGFSYIIWVMAQKETGYVKTTGLVIACGIAALTVILAIFGSFYGGRMGGGMMGGGKIEMKMGEKASQKMMMEMMKKNPEMMKMMKEMK